MAALLLVQWAEEQRKVGVVRFFLSNEELLLASKCVWLWCRCYTSHSILRTFLLDTFDALILKKGGRPFYLKDNCVLKWRPF